MDNFLKFLLALVMMLLPLLIKAQDCENTYRQGVELRKTFTIEAQNQAIYLFQQARECFTDEADRARCDRQIDLCCKVITRLGGTPVLAHNEPQSAAEPVAEPVITEPVAPVPAPVDTVSVEQPVEVVDTVAVEAVVEVPAAEEPSVSAPQPAAETPVAEVVEEIEEPVPAEEPAEESSDMFTVSDEVVFEAKDAKPFIIQYDPSEEPVIKYKNNWIDVTFENGDIIIKAADNDGAERKGRVIIVGKTMRYQFEVTQKRKKGFKLF